VTFFYLHEQLPHTVILRLALNPEPNSAAGGLRYTAEDRWPLSEINGEYDFNCAVKPTVDMSNCNNSQHRPLNRRKSPRQSLEALTRFCSPTDSKTSV